MHLSFQSQGLEVWKGIGLTEWVKDFAAELVKDSANVRLSLCSTTGMFPFTMGEGCAIGPLEPALRVPIFDRCRTNAHDQRNC